MSRKTAGSGLRFATASVLVAEIGSLPTVLLISKAWDVARWLGFLRELTCDYDTDIFGTFQKSR